MKKYLLVLFSLVLILSACGSSDETKADNEKSKIEDIEEEKEEKEEQEEQEEQEQIEVAVDVEPIIQDDGKVYFLGETNLPDHGELMFTINGNDYTSQTKEVIVDGAFETEVFSKEGETMPEGDYELSISLSVSNTQDEKFVKLTGDDYELLTGELMNGDGMGKTMNYDTSFSIGESKKKEPIDTEEELKNTMSDDVLKKTIEDTGMGEGDKLIGASIDNGEIKAIIELASDDLFPEEVMASTRYSQLSDELLAHEGWETLTIEYVNVGIVSMDRSEKESNEYGDYFSTEKIDEVLGIVY